MGRSVNYLNNAETVIYFRANWLNGIGKNGEYDEITARMNYEDFIYNLISEITSKLKSYSETDKWGNRETKILLENSLCNIGISEYCGCWSLSVAPREDIEYNKESLALNHAYQIRKALEQTLQNVGVEVLSKVGTFSNGNSVYKIKKV